MMERTLEELMGRKVTSGEHDEMRRIYDDDVKTEQFDPDHPELGWHESKPLPFYYGPPKPSRNIKARAKAKAARWSRKRNR